MKLEVLAEEMNDAGAATVLGEIETVIRRHIAEKGLRRMIKIKGGK